MGFPEDQTTELREFGDVSTEEDGGTPYLLIKQVQMPDGCTPTRCDILLCPVKGNGYNSKLYFAARIQAPKAMDLNWQNDNVFRILETNWYSFSWQLPEPNLKLRPAQLLALHLKPLRPIKP